MQLMDYKLFGIEERLQYLDSQVMAVGMPYFGGKSRIGKYIYNNIFNMAVNMHDEGNEPIRFVDAFTGGGKIGLSMPDGWFDSIVMNDLDYGVYSYYKCCQDNYRLLIATVNKLVDNFSEEIFRVCLQIRQDRSLNEYMCGAMTYLCCLYSFNNVLDSEKASYKAKEAGDNKEFEPQKVKDRASKTITKVAKQFKRRNYTIENLSYEQLIAKYNNLTWSDVEGKEHEAENDGIKNENIMWYFDPPYHPCCLHGAKDAPYANTFDYDAVAKMTKILSGEDKTYGELKYWIKSDYDPKETIANMSKSDSNYTEILKHKNDFDSIEDKAKGFQKICIGGFDKTSSIQREKGYEYLWTRGLPENYIELDKYINDEKI